jgi:hypothetical protein
MLIDRCIGERVEKVLIMYEKPIVVFDKIRDGTRLLDTLKKCFKIHKRKGGMERRIADRYRKSRGGMEQESGLSLLEKTKELEEKKRRTMRRIQK